MCDMWLLISQITNKKSCFASSTGIVVDKATNSEGSFNVWLSVKSISPAED